MNDEYDNNEQGNGKCLVENIYSADSILKQPSALLPDMWRDLLASRDLAWRLFVRDVSSRHRQSFLGLFWVIIPTVVLAVGLVIIREANILNVGNTELPYIVYVIFGMVFWKTFTESMMAPILALQKARPMMAKIHFPHEALIIAKVLDVLLNFSIMLILLIGLVVWFRLGVGWQILLFPFSLASLMAFGFFIGIILAPISALYLDVSRGLSIATGAWFFITPVIYPQPESGLFSIIVNFNPATHLLMTSRELATATVSSNLPGFLISALIAWGGLVFAWIIFRIAMPYIIERMSA